MPYSICTLRPIQYARYALQPMCTLCPFSVSCSRYARYALFNVHATLYQYARYALLLCPAVDMHATLFQYARNALPLCPAVDMHAEAVSTWVCEISPLGALPWETTGVSNEL